MLLAFPAGGSQPRSVALFGSLGHDLARDHMEPESVCRLAQGHKNLELVLRDELLTLLVEEPFPGGLLVGFALDGDGPGEAGGVNAARLWRRVDATSPTKSLPVPPRQGGSTLLTSLPV